MEQREFKFRAFDDGKMLTMPLDTNFGISRFFGILRDDAIVMQFTGKKDCTGKEVYEGDIVEFDKQEWGGDDNIHVVSWNERDAEWCFGGGSASDMEWRTVIGNIYENPNLVSERS